MTFPRLKFSEGVKARTGQSGNKKYTDVRHCRIRSGKEQQMGYKKALHHRDEISGLHVHDDIQDGTHGAEDLARRNQARQDSINKAIKADWPENQTSASDANIEHPAYGNAASRFPKPSDFIVGSKAARFGSSAEDDTSNDAGGAAQKPAKQKGIEQAKRRG